MPSFWTKVKYILFHIQLHANSKIRTAIFSQHKPIIAKVTTMRIFAESKWLLSLDCGHGLGLNDSKSFKPFLRKCHFSETPKVFMVSWNMTELLL